ncbi:hypothetical protein [Streptomyces axinellae]
MTGSTALTGGSIEDQHQVGLEWVPMERVSTLATLSHDYRERIAALADPRIGGAAYLGYHD